MIRNPVKLYIKSDTLTPRIALHDKYSVNKYGFANWVFDQYVLREGMNVLELGCGTASGWAGRVTLPVGINVCLSDFSPLMVKKAEDALGDNPAFSFKEIDIQDIPFKGQSFDLVIANHMLYHVPDINKALSEVSRVLKPSGRFCATTIGWDSLKELSDMYRKMDYINSYNDIPANAEEELRGYINAQFIDGVFKIRKTQGMFISSLI
ncbi:MAG: class I SAM-dependent methyltransferase [Clostridiales bacterium]|nr:class I SAM-dependent methyltransferase [Clostridiales bacterium]